MTKNENTNCAASLFHNINNNLITQRAVLRLPPRAGTGAGGSPRGRHAIYRRASFVYLFIYYLYIEVGTGAGGSLGGRHAIYRRASFV